MKYYSELTHKVYDTEKSLTEAEDEFNKALAAEEEKKQNRAARAKEVEQAGEAVLEAQKKYTELRNKFIEDYGSFHMSLTRKTTVPQDFGALVDWFFNF